MLGLCFKLPKSCAIDPDLFLVFETMVSLSGSVSSARIAMILFSVVIGVP